MSGRAVVAGAKMECSAGTTPCLLNPTRDSYSEVGGAVLATVHDNDPGPGGNFFVNFGFCKLAFKPCKPMPVGPWQPGESGVRLENGTLVLDEQSFLICSVGPGLIKITDPGQSFFYVDTGSMNVELVYDGGDLVGYVAEKGGIIRVYDTEGTEVDLTEEPVQATNDIELLIDVISMAGLGRQLFKKMGGKKLLGFLGIKSAKEIAERQAQRWAANIRAMLQRRLQRKRNSRDISRGTRTGASPYSTRVDPQFPGRPHPQWSIDTRTFPSGAGTKNGGIRNSKEFWRRWADQNPETLSPANKSRVKEGISPKVDEQWAQHFPEHVKHNGDTIVHHHVDQGRYAIPVPESAHKGSGGPHHGKEIKEV